MALHLVAQMLPQTHMIHQLRTYRVPIEYALMGEKPEIENRLGALSMVLMLQSGKLLAEGTSTMHIIFDHITHRAHTFAAHQSERTGQFTIYDPSLRETLTLPEDAVPHTDMAPFRINEV